MFGLNIPIHVEDVPQTLLNPINAWSKSDEYKAQAQDLIDRFKRNFEKFGEEVSDLAKMVDLNNKKDRVPNTRSFYIN